MFIMVANNNIRLTLGAALKKIRESKNLTQEGLAEKLGLQSYQTINRIENGKSFITSDLLQKMCDFFDVSPAYFFIYPEYRSDNECIDYVTIIKKILPTLAPNRLKDIYMIINLFSK